MKSISELKNLLAEEINIHKNNLHTLTQKSALNINSLLGNIPDLLSGILHQSLKNTSSWNLKHWIDGIIVQKIQPSNQSVLIWGVAIFGDDSGQQWTAPCYFNIKLNDNDTLNEMIFYFEDKNTEKLPYEIFEKDRSIWDQNFYSDNNWNAPERSWKYKISI